MRVLVLVLACACARPVATTPSNVGYVIAPVQCQLAAPPIVSTLTYNDPEVTRRYLSELQSWSIDLWLCVMKPHPIPQELIRR